MPLPTAPLADLPAEEPEAQQPVPPGGVSGGANGKGGKRPLGPLLDLPEPEVAKLVERLMARDGRRRKRRRAVIERNAAWRRGVRNVRIIEDTDQDIFQVRYGFGARAAPPAPNKTDLLVRRSIANILTVDPPIPEIIPASDDEDEQDGAELAERIARAENDGLVALIESAANLAGHARSGFIYACLDPKGGGWEPQTVLAHPMAESADAPTLGPEGPETNEANLVTRYVREDGTLTNRALEAAIRWLPKVQYEVLSPLHVSLLPETARDIDDAEGVVILRFTTLGKLREKFGERLGKLSIEELHALVAWRPKGDVKAADLAPVGVDPEEVARATEQPATPRPEEPPPDDALVVAPVIYCRASGSYPKGAYVVVAGGKHVLHRQPWSAEVGEGDEAREEALMLPVAQVKWWEDAVGGDWAGQAPVEHWGAIDEARMAQLSAILEYLWFFNNRLTFLPIGSIIQPGMLGRARASGEPILVNPDGKPETETPPPPPTTAMEMFQALGQEMDDESSLQETAQGTQNSSVKSGKQAQTIIEQALAGLTPVHTRFIRAWTRLHAIALQHQRAFFTTEQTLRYQGDDGSYRRTGWSAVDLHGAKDVKLQKGTGTMLSLGARLAMAREELEMGLTAQDPNAYARYRRTARRPLDSILGDQDEKARQRVKRQIDAWEEGPSPELEQASLLAQQAMAAYDQQAMQLQAALPPMAQQAPMGQPPMDMGAPAPALGAPVGAGAMDPLTAHLGPRPTDPLTEAAGAIFAPMPQDDDPSAAFIRQEELRDLLDAAHFAEYPPAWQEPVLAAYVAARTAAGIVTMAEQQMAQQQQYEDEQAMRSQEMQLTAEGENAKLEAEAASLEADAKAKEAEIGERRADRRSASMEKAADRSTRLRETGMKVAAQQQRRPPGR